MSENVKIFANGMIYKAPRENAPTFIKGSVSIKVDDFIAFLTANNTNSGWINIDFKESQAGKLYAELNTYKPEKPGVVDEPKEQVIEYPNEEISPDSIPF